MNILLGLCSKVLPAMVCDFQAKHPFFMLPLAASFQTLIISNPADPFCSIPDITDESLKEDSKSLLLKGEKDAEWCLNRKKRRDFFSKPENLQ